MVNGLLAQLVEQVTLNHRVGGSKPSQPTSFTQEFPAFGGHVGRIFQSGREAGKSSFINLLVDLCALSGLLLLLLGEFQIEQTLFFLIQLSQQQ